jgi:hypothetical protein
MSLNTRFLYDLFENFQNNVQFSLLEPVRTETNPHDELPVRLNYDIVV